jgi:hypothetical protein
MSSRSFHTLENQLMKPCPFFLPLLLAPIVGAACSDVASDEGSTLGADAGSPRRTQSGKKARGDAVPPADPTGTRAENDPPVRSRDTPAPAPEGDAPVLNSDAGSPKDNDTPTRKPPEGDRGNGRAGGGNDSTSTPPGEDPAGDEATGGRGGDTPTDMMGGRSSDTPTDAMGGRRADTPTDNDQEPESETTEDDIELCAGGAAQGDRRCRQGDVEECADGSFSLVEECPNVCADGACTGECTPGAAQCSDQMPLVCDVTGQWTSEGACPFVCADGQCAGQCVPGSMQCSGGAPQTCDSNGSWVSQSPCPFVCSAGQCAGECNPGAAQCAGLVPQTCNSQGRWVSAQSCPFACNAGLCVGECVAGDTQCLDVVPRTCGADGEWTSLAACPFACNNGQCAGQCVPGDARCTNDTLETCNAQGLWQATSSCENGCADEERCEFPDTCGHWLQGCCSGECQAGLGCNTECLYGTVCDVFYGCSCIDNATVSSCEMPSCAQAGCGAGQACIEELCVTLCAAPGGGQSTCANGNVCVEQEGQTDGICLPRCDLPGLACAGDYVCTEQGYCELEEIVCPPIEGALALPFFESFDTYPVGRLLDAGSPWVRASQGREGNVTTAWAFSGAQSLEIYSFTTSTEKHYVPLNVPENVSRVDVELMYAPNGFFVFQDFAAFGLGCAQSLFDLEQIATVSGSGRELSFSMSASTQVLDNELDFGSAAFPESSPEEAIYNYIRLEFDIVNRELRTFLGPDENAPLKSAVDLPASLSFNAFFVAGGLNPTHFDDIAISIQ